MILMKFIKFTNSQKLFFKPRQRLVHMVYVKALKQNKGQPFKATLKYGLGGCKNKILLVK